MSNLNPDQFELSHGDAMDAIEAAFKKHAAWTDGTPNPEQSSRNLTYAARMTGYEGHSYVEAVDHLARKHNTADAIQELPRRAARARS